MDKQLKELIASDLHRYGEDTAVIGRPLQVRYLIAYRKASFYQKNTIPGIFWRLRLASLSERSGIQIPTRTTIGKGFYLGHFGTVIINPEAVIGENVNIATGVTIGKTNRGEKAGAPVIGSRVWIGTNAVIVGGITIGDDVLIAPNAYVNRDIPSHSIVIGNPAEVHPKENATQGYVNRTV
jgi:serine O-acetyltransferase